MKINSGQRDWLKGRFDKWQLLFMVTKSCLVVVVIALSFYQSAWAIIPLSMLGGLYFYRELQRYNRKRKDLFSEQFKECILSVTASLQSGYAIENAFLESREDMKNMFGENSDIYQELEYLRRGLVVNITLEELLYDLAKRNESEDAKQFARIFMIAKKRGGNLPEIIRNTADMINQKLEAKKEIMTLLSGKEMEQNIMKLMPFLFLAYIGKTYPGYFEPLYHNWQGICVMTICLVLYVASIGMSDKIFFSIRQKLEGKENIQDKPLGREDGKKRIAIIGEIEQTIYRLLFKNGDGLLCSDKVGHDLKRLYPGEDKGSLKRTYYMIKVKNFLLITCGGILLGVLLHFQTMEDGGNDKFPLIVGGSALLSVILFFLKDKDLHDQVEKQKEIYRLQYPDIVHKLVLYLGAGVSIRGSFKMLAEDYEAARFVCRELEAGVTEAVAYDRFGKRTGVQEYMRFGTLLVQNLKKGNSTLLSRLEEEAYKSSLDRVQAAKKMGEEAATKLLFPMMLLLACVMLMIMVPAFSGMEI